MKYNKILVTGSSGFIGSHMADTLEENGYQVILFDVVPSNYKTKTQEEFIGDILNPDDITTAIKGCDAVYHFAALADLDEALDNPAQTVEVNLLGTINILEACRKNNVERFIYASRFMFIPAKVAFTDVVKLQQNNTYKNTIIGMVLTIVF